jgi:hypothetical protein
MNIFTNHVNNTFKLYKIQNPAVNYNDISNENKYNMLVFADSIIGTLRLMEEKVQNYNKEFVELKKLMYDIQNIIIKKEVKDVSLLIRKNQNQNQKPSHSQNPSASASSSLSNDQFARIDSRLTVLEEGMLELTKNMK